MRVVEPDTADPESTPTTRPWWWVGGPMFPPTEEVRDRRQIDAFLDQRLNVSLPAESEPDLEVTDYDVYGFPVSSEAGQGAMWASWVVSCIRRARTDVDAMS